MSYDINTTIKSEGRERLLLALHLLDLAGNLLADLSGYDIPTGRNKLKRRIKDRCLRAASVAFYDELMSWEDGKRIGLEDFDK